MNIKELKARAKRFGGRAAIAVTAGAMAIIPASATLNISQMTADFTDIGSVIEASVTIFDSLVGLVVALIPIIIIIAIAKFIPGVFDEILSMFKFK